MSVFDTFNPDLETISPNDVSTGPRVGFMENMANSYDSQVRTANMQGLQDAFRAEEADQVQRMQKAGVESIPVLNPEATDPHAGFVSDPVMAGYGAKRYLDTARFFVNGGDQATADHLNEYDKRIIDLQKRFPDLGLKHARDLWDTVVQKAQRAEHIENTERTTWGGTAGGLIGSVAGQFDIRSNPLGPLAFAAGGIGKTAIARIASEGLGQGAVQGLSELTGTAENRRLLGLEDGIAGSVSRVAGAAIGGAALRGIGEGLHFAGKRWFRSVPGDEAPPPPPEPGQLLLTDQRPKDGPPGASPEQEAAVRDLLSGAKTMNDVLYPAENTSAGRMGKARSILDTDYAAAQLEPFDGKQPWEIPPPAATAIPKRVSTFVSPEIPVDIHDPGVNIDAAARQIDPKLFMVFDQLTQEKNSLHALADGLISTDKESLASQKARAGIAVLADKIDNLKNNISKTPSLERGRLRTKLNELVKEHQQLTDKFTNKEPVASQVARVKALGIDAKIRNMKPLIERAYAYAKNQWELNGADRELFQKMIREGSSQFPPEAPPILNDTYENTLARFSPALVDRAPILEQAPSVEAKMAAGSDAADYASAIVKENMKALDSALDQFRTGLSKILSGEDGTIKINGQDYNLHLDEDHVYVPTEDGEGSRKISIRDFLTESAETEEELKAVNSCSIL